MDLGKQWGGKLFKKLDESKATGPDKIPATILKRIGDLIAQPFTILCRRLLHEGCWPRIWRLHQICPLYKRKTVFHARNFRGIHLTTILSKTAERIIGRLLIPFLQHRCFGANQWAFTPKLSARDLVTALLMSSSGELVIGTLLSGSQGRRETSCEVPHAEPS